MYDIWRYILNGILIIFWVLYNILICNVKWIYVCINCGIYLIIDSLNYFEMMLYIYYIEGDFVVWFEIYVFLLFFLKKKYNKNSWWRMCVNFMYEECLFFREMMLL